jgi:hypothetical protein
LPILIAARSVPCGASDLTTSGETDGAVTMPVLL